MRYFLSIDLNKTSVSGYSFSKTELAKHLKVEQQISPEKYIGLTVLTYLREKPGLIESNWQEPSYTNDAHFIFIGGSVLYRNAYRKNDKPVPTAADVLEIITTKGDDHYKILKGNYYIVLLSKIDMKIKVYSSPMFMYPAFYSFQNNIFTFSNHIGSFKDHISITLDKQGLVEMDLFDHCLHTRTIYNEIKNFPGGYRMEFTNEKISETLVYDLATWYTKTTKSKKYALPEINESLKTSINDWVTKAEKFNISFTGGFDGRLNFSFINKDKYPQLHAINYGLPGSLQIDVPKKIADSLGFICEPVYLSKEFEERFADLAMSTIDLTGGVTGFNRAVYTYAYDKIKDFSRSCILGQCDMIRPLYNNPAGVIFNQFSWPVFFETREVFIKNVQEYKSKSIINTEYYTDEIINNIYNEIKDRYINKYPDLNSGLQFYFFLQKESLMKYWHTEFHIVNVYVDDYVSFADLDYLELLFKSKYAGIYKGLLAKSQWERKTPHDLYIDLMAINNDKLNYFYNDRFFKPGWLKHGRLGWVVAAVAKKIGKYKRSAVENDTFDMAKWSKPFYKKFNEKILKQGQHFNNVRIAEELKKEQNDSGSSYRFNRMISQKIWIENFIG